MVEVYDGRVAGFDCDTGTCQTCGVNRAKRRAAAITWCQRQQDRSRLITLTNCLTDWQGRRGQVRDMRRRLVKAGYDIEWIWTTERGSQTGMVHVHAIQHGSYIAQSELQDAWGGRIVDVRAVKDAAAYISKSATRVAGYIAKGVSDGADGLSLHLGLNGGRLHHWSRGFFSGMSIRDAEAAARTDSGDGWWIAVFRGDSSDTALVQRARAAASAGVVLGS